MQISRMGYCCVFADNLSIKSLKAYDHNSYEAEVMIANDHQNCLYARLW